MSFRRRAQSADELIAELQEQVRALRSRSGSGLGSGSLSLGELVVDATVAGVELVEPDEDTLGTAAVTTTPTPTIGRIPVLDADGSVVAWLAAYDVV